MRRENGICGKHLRFHLWNLRFGITTAISEGFEGEGQGAGGILQTNILSSNERLAKVLSDGKLRIKRALQKAVKGSVNPESLSQVERDLSKEYELLNREIDAWGRDTFEKVSEEERVELLGKLGIRRPKVTEPNFSRKYVEDSFKYFNPTDAESLAAVKTGQMQKEDIRDLRKVAIEVGREAAIEGYSLDRIKKEMQDRLVKKVTDPASWRFIDVAGKKWEPGNYFHMLSRTLVNGAVRSSFVNTMVTEGRDLAMVINGGPAPCTLCKPWNRKVISLSGGNKSYPSLQESEEAGVWHPNCLCYLGIVDETADQEELEIQKREEPLEDVELEPVGEEI